MVDVPDQKITHHEPDMSKVRPGLEDVQVKSNVGVLHRVLYKTVWQSPLDLRLAPTLDQGPPDNYTSEKTIHHQNDTEG